MIVLLSQILGNLFKNSVLKYIHNSKHVFSFLPSNPNIKDITVLSLIWELRFNVSGVSMSGLGAMGFGVGVGGYQPGVYVPLKALFLVI